MEAAGSLRSPAALFMMRRSRSATRYAATSTAGGDHMKLRYILLGAGLALGCVRHTTAPVAQQLAAPFALDFVQSYVNIPDDTALDLTSTWTIEAWVYARNASSGSDQDVVSKWDGVGDASYILQIDATGHLRLVTNNGVTQTIVHSKATLPNSQWRHVAATFDGNNTTGTVKLYINGAIDTTVASALTPMNSTQPLAFGREGNFAGGLFNGVIDEVRLWKVARTATELATFSTKNLVGNELGLVGYWQFNEGTGDVVFDRTARGNKGRLGVAVGVDAWDPVWSSLIVAPIP
jgi:hypothetical protein